MKMWKVGSWEFEIKFFLGEKQRVLAGTDIDLTDLSIKDDKPVMQRLIEEYQTAADVLWYIIKPEADAQSIGQQQLYDLLDGDTIANGVSLLADEIVDFFPPRDKPTFSALWQRANSTYVTARKRATRMLNDPKFEEAIERVMDEKEKEAYAELAKLSPSTLTSGNSPVSPGSVPTVPPSEN